MYAQRYIFWLLLSNYLLLSSCIQAAVSPYYSIRSPGVNAPRHVVGLTTIHDTLDNNRNNYRIFSITPAYTRTFKNDHITKCIFGDNLVHGNQIKIAGSAVLNRNTTDWLADYFYLPTDFESTLTFNPRIDNFLIDINAYFNLDRWYRGFYIALYAPFVHTRWHLHMDEQVINPGVNPHNAGYFTPSTLERKKLLRDFASFAQGASIDPIVQTVGANNFTIAAQPLTNAKISPKRRVKSRLADIRIQLGWHIIDDATKQCGIYAQVAAPIGNKPKGFFLFEPIASNGHHWELGAGFNASYHMWCNADETKSMVFGFYATITHLLDTRQHRTFDLKNSTFNRYMLAERLGTNRRAPPLTGASNAGVEFQREFAPVTNLTRLCVDVSVGAQADIVAMGTFIFNNFSCDIGYNLWARSKEHITPRGFNPLQNNQTWALKGDASVYGFAPPFPSANVIHLAPTQSSATMRTGTNALKAIANDPTQAANTNIGVDNPVFATIATGNVIGANGQPIRTSNPVVFIKESDVNIEETETRGLSSKLFTHINYTWSEHNHWIPCIGLGGEIEFDHAHNNMSNKTQKLRCASSQWGLWIKGGIAFD